MSVQTYNRKIDLDLANTLASFRTTCEHIGIDLCHLAMLKEVEEPFKKYQIGLSAIAQKRNPTRSERMCSPGRKLVSPSPVFGGTYTHQWVERSG